MYVFQSREFLDIWLDTIGKASRIEPYFIVVRDADGRPVLYLPLIIETKFNVRLLRFMDCGVADYNAPIVAADRALSRQEFHEVWADVLALLPGFDVIDLKKIASDVAGAVNPLTYLDCTPFGESGHAIVLTRLRDQTDTRRAVARQRRKLQSSRQGAEPDRRAALHRQSCRCRSGTGDGAAIRAQAPKIPAHVDAGFSRGTRRRALLSRDDEPGPARHNQPSFGADDRRHRGVGASRLHRARPVLLYFPGLRHRCSAATASAISCCST